MEFYLVDKPTFSVLGLEGSTQDGPDFIAGLWAEVNRRFSEIAQLVYAAEDGTPLGVWGLMSDVGRRFLPWEDSFTRGLYLAGAECPPQAAPPPGWTRWDAPGSRYLVVDSAGPEAFQAGLLELSRRGLTLAGAVYDHTQPKSRQSFQYFPVQRL